MSVGWDEDLVPEVDPGCSTERGLVSTYSLSSDHIVVNNTKVGHIALGLRRALDISVASVLLVIFAIPAAIIALLVAATSRGGALFSQTRIGRGGQPITVLKFRSMCDGAHDLLHADEELRAAYVSNDFKLDGKHDPRITKIGRFLRKTSLDELPQLWNVLRGDMSMVGIRPLLFDELALRPEYDQTSTGSSGPVSPGSGR
jgi:lipopolysaccharide/colanic/teichoic acid biosynthesis glycosyltransferase